MSRSVAGRLTAVLPALLMLWPAVAPGQDRLPSMPGYPQYRSMAPQYAGTMISGSILGGGRGLFGRGGTGASQGFSWSEDGKGFDYSFNGKRFHYDLKRRVAVEATEPPAAAEPAIPGGRGRGGMGGPARGRQFTTAESPDGKHTAIYRDRNLYLTGPGADTTAITTDGNAQNRVKYGTASWVYGEELGQTTAMWWNPAGTRLAYFRFDESKVPDFYLTTDATKLQTTLDVEAYPKAGVPNPVVDLYVYDVATRRSTRVDVRDGKPFTNDVVGHYAYGVRWSPDGSELLVHRTNRRQNILELTGCSPETGRCRVIIRESWPTGWVDNTPTMRFLSDSNRFLWQSERNGFSNYYLYNLKGDLLATVTHGDYEAANIVRVDEKSGTLWYMARDGDNFMKMQLHRVNLDGSKDRRLTDPAFNHQVDISPDGKYIVDVAQTHDQAPVSRLLDGVTGRLLGELAHSDLSVMEQRHIRKVELFSFLAADGKTKLYGSIAFPSNFDPAKKYPVLMPVYGGPASGSNTPTETFSTGNPQTEYGFLVVNLHTRASPGMGKRTLDALYEKLGQTEIDDMAAGIRALYDRPYVDRDRVGIQGTSYGGYSSVMAILRYPDVFAAAASQSPVTAWDNYDTIYTERYMWIPQENPEGYKLGSAMHYAGDLRGRLMLYYGTADNNVHPNNMMQLITALQRAGKHFDVQVGPDAGHSAMNQARMMEFFIENLVVHPSEIRVKTPTP